MVAPNSPICPSSVMISRSKYLLRVAWVMLIGQGVNLFMLVEPGLMGSMPVIGLWELAPVIGAFALFFYLTLRSLANAPLAPWKDPHFDESMHYHC